MATKRKVSPKTKAKVSKANVKAAVSSAPKRDIYEEVTNRIIQQLEQGAIPWLKPWTAKSKGNGAFATFERPQNAVTGRKYSGVNVLLLWDATQANSFSSPKWLTFKQAKELGGSVRKGEKSTTIYFAKPFVKTSVNEATGNEEDKSFIIWKAYNVFNVGQCENLPERITNNGPVVLQPVVTPGDKIELCPVKSAWVKATGVVLNHGGTSAHYTPARDAIQMPVPEDFDTENHYWATLFHEQIHWTGATHRLDRTFGQRFGDQAYAMEELVAEMGAAFLCADHGVTGDLRHAGYVQNWLNVLKNDKRAIFTAASKASKAADLLHSFSSAEEADNEETMAA